MKRLAILGASGHGKVVAEIAELRGWKEVVFYDDAWPSLISVGVWSVVGNMGDLQSNVNNFDAFFVAVGHNSVRWELFSQLACSAVKAATLIHPSAVVSQYSSVKEGTVVMANAVINPFVTIGQAVIVNTAATIDHDCILGDAVHISPGANLAGEVTVGHQSWVGIGANVKQQVIIGEKVIVGAGATAINNMDDGVTVVGTPAK